MPYTRPYASGFVDSPATTTPINSTALNTMDLGIKTANDQIQSVTTTQRNALTPTVGQMVWDSTLNQFMVYMNATGGNAWQPVGNTIVCASTTRPLTPFEGQIIYETDTNRAYVYDGSVWKQWMNTAWLPAAGSYANRYDRKKRTSGNITLSSSLAWANVDTNLDITLNASAGDVIEYCVSGIVGSAAVEAYFDVVTIVSGSPTNSFGYDAAPANPTTSYGVSGWFCLTGAVATIAGSAFRTLVSGDISSGTVTLRLRYGMQNATTRTLNATTAQPLEVWARNLGPVTT